MNEELKPCPFCGAYSSRNCEMADESVGVFCPWEESKPDPDRLREEQEERRRIDREYGVDNG